MIKIEKVKVTDTAGEQSRMLGKHIYRVSLKGYPSAMVQILDRRVSLKIYCCDVIYLFATNEDHYPQVAGCWDDVLQKLGYPLSEILNCEYPEGCFDE